MAQLVAMFKESTFLGGGKGEKNIVIDSWTFKLFNKATTGLLVLGSIAVTARQFFGEPIRCDAGKVRSGRVGWRMGDRWKRRFNTLFFRVARISCLPSSNID